jgi:soluble lytic murein transglycosylase-like protein
MTAARQSHLAAGILVIILTLFVTPCLKADIYVYIDKDGVYHFTNVPTSERYKVYMRENAPMPFFSGNSRAFDDVISEAARLHGLEFSLLKALIHVESSFNPRAVSKKGAMGLTQIMPATSQLLKIGDPFDPWENIMGGASYLRSMLDRFDGHLGLALAAYNAGPSAVERYNSIPPFRETRDYVDKVLRFFRHYTAD